MTSSPWAHAPDSQSKATATATATQSYLQNRRHADDQKALLTAAATLELWLDKTLDGHFNAYFDSIKSDGESAHYPDLYIFHHGDKIRYAATSAMATARDMCLGIDQTDPIKTVQEIAAPFGGMPHDKAESLCNTLASHKSDYLAAQSFPTPHMDHEYILCTYLDIYVALHEAAVHSGCYSAVEETLSRKHPSAVLETIDQLEKGIELEYIFAVKDETPPAAYVDISFNALDTAIKYQILALENHARQNPFTLAADPTSMQVHHVSHAFLCDMLDGLWNLKSRHMWQNLFEQSAANMVDELAKLPESHHEDFTPPPMNEMYGIAGFVMQFYNEEIQSDPQTYTKDITDIVRPIVQQTMNMAHLFAGNPPTKPSIAPVNTPT